MATTKLLKLIALIGVLAIGLTACSDDSDTPAALTGDTAPPAIPSNVYGGYSAGAGYVDLAWDQNVVDADFAGVLISRSTEDRPAVQLTETLYTGTTFRDYDPGIGANVYSIVAVDENGNQSAAATVLVVRPGEHAPNPTTD